MTFCGVSYQKTMSANVVRPDLNRLLQRFETNVEALDELLTNYNVKLNECINKKCAPEDSRIQKFTEKKTEFIKVTPKPPPKPQDIRINEVKGYDCRKKTYQMNFKPIDGFRKAENGHIKLHPIHAEPSQPAPLAGHRELLQRSYNQLVNYISCADDISARLFQSNHLTQSELESIQLANCPTKASQLLLNILLRKSFDVYRVFLDELQRTRQGHVLSILLNTDTNSLEHHHHHHAKLIRQHYVFLTETIEVIETGLLNHLVAEKVLTDRERSAIGTEWNRYRQVESLLSVIARKSSKEFEAFLRALSRTNQNHISDVLQGIVSDSEISSQPKTERASFVAAETDFKATVKLNNNPPSTRNFHHLSSKYSELPFSLRVEISAKFLSIQSKTDTNIDNRQHADTVLEGLVEVRKSLIEQLNESNELSDENSTLKTEIQSSETQLRSIERELVVLKSEFNSTMSELLKLRLQHSDTRLEKERVGSQLEDSRALNERLTIKLQEAVLQINRRNEVMVDSETFRLLQKECEQLKSKNSELEKRKEANLAESELLKTRSECRVKQIEKESEIQIEKLRLETSSRLSELTRQSDIAKITIESLHNEIARLNGCINVLELDNHRILNELMAEKEKALRVQSTCIITRYQANHLDRLDLPGTWIEAAATVDDRLYLICRGSSQVTVYSAHQRPRSRQYAIPITGMMGPIDIVACPTHRCLYITDSGARCVWRLYADDQRYNKWLSDVTWPFTLSVTSDGRVLMTRRPSRLDVYDADGRIVRCVPLPPSIIDPWHAIDTADDTYMVIHGDKISQRHGVTELTQNGEQVVRSCGGLPGKDPGTFDRPRYLGLGADGLILVADYGNSRIVMVDSSLNFVQVLLKKEENGMKNPLRICSGGNPKTFLVVNNGLLDTYIITKSCNGTSNSL